jgi:N-ethylmaleimide reductase
MDELCHVWPWAFVKIVAQGDQVMTRGNHDSSPDGAQPLLRPFDLGDLHLPNRIVMAPLTRARASNEDRTPTDLHAEYYCQRASAGLMITEGVWVSERAVGFVNVPGIYTEPQAEAWTRITTLVHALGGRIVLQLWHAGANSHPDHLGGAVPAGPSRINPNELSVTPAGRKETVVPREMTAADIAQTTAEYRTAAEHARRAGFDGVEVAANGTYLLAQFLNPRLNRRTDRYGLDRHRLVLEIVDAVADVWGHRRVGVRLSPYWCLRDRSHAGQVRGEYRYTADERTLADYDDLVAELSERATAFLHIRGRAPIAPGAAADFDAIARYRALFRGPLIANHGFDRETGNAIVEAGIADAVSFARLFIANPDLVSRFALSHALASSDRSTYYTGGAHGYVDYPIWSPA